MATKTYEEVVLEDAPEIYLRLAETSGTDAADETRFGRDFTHVGSPTLDQTGPVNKAVTYDGSDDETTYSANMPITGFPFTVEYWAKTPGTTSSNANYSAVEIADSSSDTEYFFVRVQTDGSNNLSVEFATRSGGASDLPNVSIPNALKGEWFHIVITFVSATERNAYINGALLSTATASVSFPSLTNISVGALSARLNGVFYAGSIAEPTFYNYELSAERIRIHHAVGRGHTDTDSYGYAVMTSGPKVWLRLQEGSGTDAADASGNKFDATHSGGPTLDQTGPLADGTTKAVSYDGSDDETVVTNSLLQPSYPFTQVVWMKSPSTTTSSTFYSFFNIEDGSADQYFSFHYRTDSSNNLQVRMQARAASAPPSVVYTLPNNLKGEWVCGAVIWRGTAERDMYINGILVQSNTDSESPTLGSIDEFTVGALGSSVFSSGEVAEPAYFDRGLSDAELRNIYAKGKQYLETNHRTKTLAKCPSLYWRQGESAGSTATDETEFGRDGTYAGTVTLSETGALVDDADTAALYDGTDGQLTYSEAFITQYPVTLEALVKLPTTPSSSTSYIRVGITDASGTMKMVAGLKTDGNTKLQAHIAEVGSSTGSTDNSCGGAIGNYHHLVAEFISDTSRKVWLNGVELEEETTSTSVTLGNLDTVCVGVEDLSTDAWYEGYCDEFVVYQRQLSTDEIRDQYLSGLGYFTNPVLGSDDAGYIQLLLGDGPKLLWPLNEASGTDVLDASRWGYDGTYVGSPTLDQSGPNSNLSSVSFDGSDDLGYYQDGNDPVLSGYPYSIEAWLRADDQSVNEGGMVGLGDGGGVENYIYVQANGDGSNIRGELNHRVSSSSFLTRQTATSVQNGKFIHCVGVGVSSTERHLYVNGRLVDTNTSSASFPTAVDGFSAGGLKRSSDLFKIGHVGYAACYTYELTQAQIAEHFIAGRGIFEADNPYLYEVGQLVPAVHYRLNEGSGSTAADLLGLRDLTIAGSPTLGSDGPIYNVTDDAAITLDGTDDAAALADDAQVTAYPTAYVGWVATPVSPGTSDVFGQMGMGDDGTGSNILTIGLKTDGSSNVTPAGYLSTGGTADNAEPTSPVLEAAVFHHIIWVQRSATDRELYVNGASVATDTTSRSFPSSLDDILLGRTAGSTFREGTIAEFSILTSDVSDSEALDLYLAAFKALSQGLTPMGEISVSGEIGAVMELFSTKELSFATLGYNSGSWDIRVEMGGSVTKDFRNVQTFQGAIGIVADLDGVVSAQFTRERNGQIDIVAEFNSPVTFEQIKAGQIDAIVDMVATKSEGDTPVTDQDIGQAIGFVAPYIEYGAIAPVPPRGRRQ